MFKTIQRYLAANFILPLVVSTLFFIAFLMTFQLFRIVKYIIAKGVDYSIILGLIGHMGVSFLPIAVPLSVLFATIFTMNRLSEDAEIVAMRSFGLSKYQIFLPLFILGIFVSLCMFSLNQNIIPHSKKLFKNGVTRLTSRGMLTEVRAGQFFTEIPGITLFAENVKEDGKILEDVFIHSFNNKNKMEKVIFAQKGRLIKLKEDKWGRSDLRMHLTNGNIVQSQKNKVDDKLEKILFESYDFPVFGNALQQELITKDSMKTSGQLWHLIKTRKEPKDKATKKEYLKTELEYWSRINTPIQCLIFILIGFSMGIKKGRGRTSGTGPLVLLILIGYYTVFFTGVALARSASIPSYVAVFFPTIIATFLGGFFFKRIDWMS